MKNALFTALLAAVACVCAAQEPPMRVRVAQFVKARTPSGVYINLPAGTEIGACAADTHIAVGYQTAARVIVVEQPCQLPLPKLLRDGFEDPNQRIDP